MEGSPRESMIRDNDYYLKALTPEILDQSLGKYVPYIFMEWVNLHRNWRHTCDQYEEFLKSFTDNGYNPHGWNLEPVPLETNPDWWDVIWIHEDAIQIKVL